MSTKNGNTPQASKPDGTQLPPADPSQDRRSGIASEVGDIEDQDAEDEAALPGRAGGGLAGG